MCAECGQYECPSSCPNAPDPEPVLYCSKCGDGIMEDDEYAVIDGNPICYGCIDDMPYSELVPLCGGEWATAKADNWSN